MKKIREKLEIDVKPCYKCPKGHKQGNAYGRTDFDDKRCEPKVKQRSDLAGKLYSDDEDGEDS